MLLLKALRNRPIALMWSGQALSAIGDEIYRVALIWLAVGLIGADTGYLAAGQSAALLVSSLLCGQWADRWDHRRTMIGVDLLRGGIVLLPVIIAHFTPLTLPVLWVVALTLAALGAFFDPALQAVLPRFSPDMETLRAATGLMATTLRLARVAGPGVIGVLTAVIPNVHFFTLDAFTFFFSAGSIFMLRAYEKATPARLKNAARLTELGFRDGVLEGFRLVWGPRRVRGMGYIMTAKAVLGGLWNLAYSLGLALMVYKIAPHDVRAFGMVIAAYGVGNLIAAVVLANLPRRRPTVLLFGGYVWLGLGFVLVGLAPSLPWMMLAAAFAAVGGPLNDIPFTDLVQARYRIEDIPKVFRLRMALETAATLVCMVVSPTLFRVLSIQLVIALCGIVTLALGWVGLMRTEPSVAPT